MRIGYTHSDVYDRESDYWRDMEDALPKGKSPSKAATDDEHEKTNNTDSISRD